MQNLTGFSSRSISSQTSFSGQPGKPPLSGPQSLPPSPAKVAGPPCGPQTSPFKHMQRLAPGKVPSPAQPKVAAPIPNASLPTSPAKSSASPQTPSAPRTPPPPSPSKVPSSPQKSPESGPASPAKGPAPSSPAKVATPPPASPSLPNTSTPAPTAQTVQKPQQPVLASQTVPPRPAISPKPAAAQPKVSAAPAPTPAKTPAPSTNASLDNIACDFGDDDWGSDAMMLADQIAAAVQAKQPAPAAPAVATNQSKTEDQMDVDVPSTQPAPTAVAPASQAAVTTAAKAPLVQTTIPQRPLLPVAHKQLQHNVEEARGLQQVIEKLKADGLEKERRFAEERKNLKAEAEKQANQVSAELFEKQELERRAQLAEEELRALKASITAASAKPVELEFNAAVPTTAAANKSKEGPHVMVDGHKVQVAAAPMVQKKKSGPNKPPLPLAIPSIRASAAAIAAATSKAQLNSNQQNQRVKRKRSDFEDSASVGESPDSLDGVEMMVEEAVPVEAAMAVATSAASTRDYKIIAEKLATRLKDVKAAAAGKPTSKSFDGQHLNLELHGQMLSLGEQLAQMKDLLLEESASKRRKTSEVAAPEGDKTNYKIDETARLEAILKDRDAEVKAMAKRLLEKDETIDLLVKKVDTVGAKMQEREKELARVAEERTAQAKVVQANEVTIADLRREIQVYQERCESTQRDLGEKSALLAQVGVERARWVDDMKQANDRFVALEAEKKAGEEQAESRLRDADLRVQDATAATARLDEQFQSALQQAQQLQEDLGRRDVELAETRGVLQQWLAERDQELQGEQQQEGELQEATALAAGPGGDDQGATPALPPATMDVTNGSNATVAED